MLDAYRLPLLYADSKAYTKPVVELLMKSERDRSGVVQEESGGWVDEAQSAETGPASEEGEGAHEWD
jgi:hypothetical protein